MSSARPVNNSAVGFKVDCHGAKRRFGKASAVDMQMGRVSAPSARDNVEMAYGMLLRDFSAVCVHSRMRGAGIFPHGSSRLGRLVTRCHTLLTDDECRQLIAVFSLGASTNSGETSCHQQARILCA